MPVWDVSRLPERDQFDYWREVICQAFVPLTPGRTEPGTGFPFIVETRPLAEVNRARIASRAQTTRHGPREVARTEGAFYFVNLQLAGRCRTRVGSTDAVVVHPGQFVLVDTAEPYYFDFDDDWRMLSFRVPHHLLHRGPGVGRPRTGVPIDGGGTGGVVTSLMRALWDVDDTAGPTARRELEQAFASAVSAATPMRAGVEPVPRATLRAAVLRYVADHLTDSSLSVTSVCRRFAVAPRTLHNAFADGDETFAATVRGMRLDSSAHVLADPAVTRTIAEVAAAHGFDDPTSFSRAFRRRFGSRPSDVRAAGISGVPAT